jgi:dTDP-glucose 4,6-dehydratase
MSYFILGSTSFAGSSLIDYLLAREEQVIGVSRSTEAHPVMLPYFHNPHKAALRIFQCDLNQDIDAIVALIKQHKPRYIIDFAGQGMVAESWQNPAQWYQTNIVAKVKLHHFLKDCDFLERYVRVSTPEVYGSTDVKVQANQPYNPSTPYAVSHAAIDMSLQAYVKQYQLPAILTRFANFYGPHQQLYRIVPRTLIYALLGKKLPLHGGGLSQRMFIYADDVSEGIYKVVQRGKVGGTYQFTTEPCVSIRDLVEKLCDLISVKMESFVEIAGERAGKDNKYEMDAADSQQELGWQPKWTLEQGLEKTSRWVRDNIEVLKTLPLEYVHKV